MSGDVTICLCDYPQLNSTDYRGAQLNDCPRTAATRAPELVQPRRNQVRAAASALYMAGKCGRLSPN